MKRTSTLIAIGAVWLATMLWFGGRQAGCMGRPRPPSAGAAADREEWHGIYLQDEKIGYSVTISRTLPGGGRAVSNRAVMRLNLMGTAQEVLAATNYSLDASYHLTDLDFRLDGAARLEISGRVDGRELELVVTSDGSRTTQHLPLDGPVYLPDALDAMIAGKTLQVGRRYDFATFDPASLSVQPAAVTVAARETLAVDGARVPAFRLDIVFSGAVSSAWVDSAGRTLKEQGPMGIVMMAEPRERAARLPDRPSGVDLLTSLAVPAQGAVPADPRATSSMRVRLSGIALAGLDVGGGRQRVTDPAGMMVAVEADDTTAAVLTDEARRRYLAPTPLIQSDDRAIVALARGLAKGRPHDRATAEAIAGWVHDNLEKRMTVSLPSAVEVLRSRRGDCNEHATLFAALARAAGVPAALCLGVVYLDGRFYYHAWNVVWCGGRRIELDPTFGQFPADAARLRLAEGDLTRQNLLLPAFGKLGIEILEAK
ncbi:MAG: transglutaminase family protein [Candidatus Edwardsbacteria bacterium]|jgi:hypothetical protein|nr:transglutaminase family protein [Candidatus Edwardsbacteria bacterium]